MLARRRMRLNQLLELLGLQEFMIEHEDAGVFELERVVVPRPLMRMEKAHASPVGCRVRIIIEEMTKTYGAACSEFHDLHALHPAIVRLAREISLAHILPKGLCRGFPDAA